MADRGKLTRTRKKLAELEASVRRAKALIKALTAATAKGGATKKAKSPAAKKAKAGAAKRVKSRATKKAETIVTELDLAPAPLPEAVRPLPVDLSKAPGKQHRRPPMNLKGVEHSDQYIAKARLFKQYRNTAVNRG